MYKRQGINTVEDLVSKSEDEMMKVRNLGRKSLEAVSYTHLDVYKRQIMSIGYYFVIRNMGALKYVSGAVGVFAAVVLSLIHI